MEASYVTEFRRLLHKLTKRPDDKELKSIMFTSSMLSEGKSTICSFLAITASMKKGMKTLLIDADLRRPTIGKLFNINRKAGLNEVLVEGFKPSEAIVKTSIDKLDVLTAGGNCHYPSEVFDPEAIGTMIDEMKFYYDMILVDTPPLLPVSDPMLLAPHLDGVLLVIKAGATQKDVVRRAVNILSPKEVNVLGVVMNNINHSLPYYYEYGYYHYEYGSPKRKSKNNISDHPSKPDKKNKKSGRDQLIHKEK